jgi:hypothetical protein
VVDFDKLTADPAHPDHLRADYDSGDHLHPSPAGYRAMADAIPLELFSSPQQSPQASLVSPVTGYGPSDTRFVQP